MYQDLFAVSMDYSLAYYVAQDLKMSKGIASVFWKKYVLCNVLIIKEGSQQPAVGEVW